jgi:hypothetical protein
VASRRIRGNLNPAAYQQLLTVSNQNPADYNTPWYMNSPVTTLRGYANEGTVRARPGGVIVRVAEGGEDESIVKTKRLGGLHLHFHGPVVGGAAGLRELVGIVNGQLGPQTAALARGR